MKATDVLQFAGLRRKIGPDGDLQAAYRRSYEAHMREHDKALVQMLKRLHAIDRGTDNGR